MRRAWLLLVLGCPGLAHAATEVLTCSATSTPDNWTLVLGATKMAAVASPDDDDTTYITSTATNGTQQQFALANPAVITGSDTINSVAVTMRTKRGGSNDVTHLATLVLGGNTTPGTTQTATNVYQTFTETLARPGGGSWSLTDLNNLELRIQNSQARQCRCTTLFVTVDYTAGTTTTTTSTTTSTTTTSTTTTLPRNRLLN